MRYANEHRQTFFMTLYTHQMPSAQQKKCPAEEKPIGKLQDKTCRVLPHVEGYVLIFYDLLLDHGSVHVYGQEPAQDLSSLAKLDTSYTEVEVLEL